MKYAGFAKDVQSPVPSSNHFMELWEISSMTKLTVGAGSVGRCPVDRYKNKVKYISLFLACVVVFAARTESAP